TCSLVLGEATFFEFPSAAAGTGIVATGSGHKIVCLDIIVAQSSLARRLNFASWALLTDYVSPVINPNGNPPERNSYWQLFARYSRLCLGCRATPCRRHCFPIQIQTDSVTVHLAMPLFVKEIRPGSTSILDQRMRRRIGFQWRDLKKRPKPSLREIDSPKCQPCSEPVPDQSWATP